MLGKILPALLLVLTLRGGSSPPLRTTMSTLCIIAAATTSNFRIWQCVSHSWPWTATLLCRGGQRQCGGGAMHPNNIGGGVGVDVKDLLMWIEGETSASASGGPGTSDRQNKLRFRLHMCWSKMLFAGLPPQGTGGALLVVTIIQVIVSAHLMGTMSSVHCTIGDVPPTLLVALLVVSIVPAGCCQLSPCFFVVLSGKCIISFWLIRSRSRATSPPSSMDNSCACNTKKPRPAT